MPTPNTNREALPATITQNIDALLAHAPGEYPEVENWLYATPQIAPGGGIYAPPSVIGWMNHALLNPGVKISETQAKAIGNAIYQLCGVTPPSAPVPGNPS
ncbi:MAG: hypothetical protein KF864_08745 [Phycisphaeraceae bacterium]|nr:hypothetical protein [Phycisphaeraceae bacterium]